MSELKDLNFELELETRENTEIDLRCELSNLLNERQGFDKLVNDQKDTQAAVAAVIKDRTEEVNQLNQKL